jgi:L-galactonate dehydratase
MLYVCGIEADTFKRFNVPIVPHSGGIGLNEYTQHLALINYLCVAGEKSLLEHINSFREVLTHPVSIAEGHFVTPLESGYSVEYKPEAVEMYRYPGGSFWQGEKGQAIIKGAKN